MKSVNPIYTFLLILVLFAGIGWHLPDINRATITNQTSTLYIEQSEPSDDKDIAHSSVKKIMTTADTTHKLSQAEQGKSGNTRLSLPERLDIIDKFIANFKAKNEYPFEAIYLNYMLINEMDLADLQQLYFDSKNEFDKTKRDLQASLVNANASSARKDLLSLMQYFIVAKIGEIDSATAANFINEHPLNTQKVSAYTSIFNTWSVVALDDMHSWLNAQKESLSDDVLSIAYFIILREYAAKDFNFALNYLANNALRLRPSILASAVSGALARATQSIHFVELIEFTQGVFKQNSLAKPINALDAANSSLANTVEKPMQDNLSDKVFYQWGSKLPQDLAAWLAKRTNINEMQAIKKYVYSQYARHDLVDATIWYRANTPVNSKDKHYDPLQWRYGDTIDVDQYQKILDWIYTEDDRYLVRIYRSVLKEAAARAPTVAIRHVALVTDPQQKRQATLDVYKGLIEAANPQAEVFLNTSQFAGDIDILKTAAYSKRNAM